MGFQTPNRQAIEQRLSQAFRTMRVTIEEASELVEDLKVEITDSGNQISKAGAQAFAESVFGIEAGTNLGQSGPWADTLVDANTAVTAIKAALDNQIARVRRVVFDK